MSRKRSPETVPSRSGFPDSAPVGLVLRRSAQAGQLDPFHQDFVRGLESRLAEAGRSLLVMLQAEAEQELQTYRRWATQGRIDGVILMDLRQGDARVALLGELGMSAVVIGDPQITLDFPTVFTDDKATMKQALRYLTGLGHRRIARIAGPAQLLHTAQRTEVYAATLAEIGVAGVQRNGDYTFESGRALTAELLSSGSDTEQNPTAIIFDDAVMAIGGLEALQAAGVQVPGEVSVLAWDDSLQCQLAGVSALSHDVAAYGELAANMLLDHLAGAPVRSQAALAPELVERASTGTAPAGTKVTPIQV